MSSLPLRASALLVVACLSACGQSGSDDEVAGTEVEVEAEPDPVANVAEPEGVGASAPAARPKQPVAEAPQIANEALKAEISPTLETCLNTGDAARGVSYAMGGCFNEELQRQDARLNAVYRGVISRLGKADRERLQAEERRWIAARDSGCAEERVGGTIDLVTVPQCLVDETIRRRLQLEAMAG